MKSIDGVCRLPKKYKKLDGEEWPTVFASVPHTHGLVSSNRGTQGRVINVEHCQRAKQPFIVVILQILKPSPDEYLGADK